MLRLNKDYVRVVEKLSWGEGRDRITHYKLESSLDDFSLGGSAELSLRQVSPVPIGVGNLRYSNDIRRLWEDSKLSVRTHILIRGLNQINNPNVEKNLPKYKLEFEGLIIPEERLEPLEELGLDLIEVYKTNFRVTSVKNGSSFLVKSEKGNETPNRRIDYVISPKNEQLDEILEALKAPSDLLLKA